MRTTRGSRDGAFSLFSFQDILTTTIGVVLLVLLVLVLDITMDAIAEVADASEPPPQTSDEPMDDDDLRSEVQRLNMLLVIAREDGVTSASRWLQEQTRRDLDDAQQRLIDAHAAHLAARNATENRRPVLEDLYDQIEDHNATVEQLEADIEAAWGDADEIAELQERRAEHGRLKQQLEGLLANPALMYIKQADKSHEPILVEITGDMIQIHAHGIAPGMPMIEFPNRSAKARCEAAVALLAQLADGRRYPLLLVKPSGAMPSLRIEGSDVSPGSYLRHLLHERRIPTGIDLLTKDQQTAPDPLLGGGGP